MIWRYINETDLNYVIILGDTQWVQETKTCTLESINERMLVGLLVAVDRGFRALSAPSLGGIDSLLNMGEGWVGKIFFHIFWMQIKKTSKKKKVPSMCNPLSDCSTQLHGPVTRCVGRDWM